MIRVEVLDDTYVVALLVWTRVLHQHAAVAVLLHVRRHLRPVEATRARLLVSDVVEVLARRAALADGGDLVLVLTDGLELVVLGVVHAVVEGFEANFGLLTTIAYGMFYLAADKSAGFTW